MRIGQNIVRVILVTQSSVPEDEFVARLVVGQERLPTSGTLRVWSPVGKSDIYAAMRGIAGECKISLHASGECLAGLTEQFARTESDAVSAMGGSRHQSRWTRATHVGSRVVTPLQFVIPSSELRPFPKSSISSSRNGSTWIVPPASGRSIIVSCLFSGQQVQDANWPGRAYQTHLVGSKHLPNGEKFWLIWQDSPTGDVERLMLTDASAHIARTEMVPFSGSNDPSEPARRFLIFKEFREDRQLIVMDAALPEAAP